MVLSPHGALFGFNVRFAGNAWTWIFISLSAPCLLLPSSFLSSPLFFFVLYSVMYVSYQELLLWSGPELSSGYEIRLLFPSELHAWQHNNTKVLVRAQLQNGAVIMMYSLQDIDVRRCAFIPLV